VDLARPFYRREKLLASSELFAEHDEIGLG
jgi:hypothetical protein